LRCLASPKWWGPRKKGKIKRVLGKHYLNPKPFKLLLYKEWAIFSLHLEIGTVHTIKVLQLGVNGDHP
jgi:hypothetical protein